MNPKSSLDLNGWVEITCWQAEIVRRADLRVASSHTDIVAPDVFTEWWTAPDPRFRREVPVLREYRDDRGCRHYLALTPEEAAEDDTIDAMTTAPSRPATRPTAERDEHRGEEA